MSIATPKKLTDKLELYNLLEERLEAVNSNKVKPFNDVISEIERTLMD